MRSPLLVAVVLLMPLVVHEAAADHDARKGGSLDDGSLGAWVEQGSAGAPGGAPDRRGSGSLPSTWTTVSHAPSTVHGIACPQAAVRVVTRHFRDGSASRVESVTCSPWPDRGPRARPAGFAPPTGAQVAEAVDLPTTSPGINPHVRGLVGLETWFWYGGPLSRTVTAALGGTEVIATATAVGFEFTTGDGAVHHSSTPGSESAPAARHVYQRHQTYTVTVTVIWAGTFSFVAPGGAVGSGDLGTVRTSASRDYPVVESQAVRTR